MSTIDLPDVFEEELDDDSPQPTSPSSARSRHDSGIELRNHEYEKSRRTGKQSSID